VSDYTHLKALLRDNGRGLTQRDRSNVANAIDALERKRDVLRKAMNEARQQDRQPDYCYDEEWEYTMPWGDRETLLEYADLSKPVPIYTLYKGPTRWAVKVLTTDDGDEEIVWFKTEDEARAALQEDKSHE
jgi:hypothetical protein